MKYIRPIQYHTQFYKSKYRMQYGAKQVCTSVLLLHNFYPWTPLTIVMQFVWCINDVTAAGMMMMLYYCCIIIVIIIIIKLWVVCSRYWITLVLVQLLTCVKTVTALSKTKMIWWKDAQMI